ncbi:lipopolysaccharide biosynthesis protein [Nocardioides sp. SYSU DS0663]|uniref:lipopolysaccharide biosynthesis protein n=1 Tax=Nocardioides sp. SYSU DS0663 TaxID=3416445 RepID=UPI003F4C1503
MRQRVRGLLAGARADRMLTNSAMLLATSALMAGFGALFWVLAARLYPAETVGVAGAIVAASDTLALFAQLGLNIAMVHTMPRSRHQAADVATAMLVVGSAAAVFALGYVLLLPLTSPRVHEVLGGPWGWALFVGLVAATAVNMLTDNVFLAIDRVRSYLWLNGLLLGTTKCLLPSLLAGAGALGLYGSAGGAALLCAVASVVVIFRRLPRRTRWRPSQELRGARGFAGAGYVTVVLALTPQLVLPLLVVNELGSAATAYFFVSLQVVALQNAVVVAVGNAMYAESERHPHRRTGIVRRGGVTMAVVCVLSAGAVWLVAPLLLHVFGPEYAAEGTSTLRVLSLSVVGLGLSYWAAMRLRLAHRPGAMVAAQVVGTTVVLVLSVSAVPHGTTWVAGALGVGYLAGGLVGLLVSRFVAPLHDAPRAVGEPDPVEAVAP